MFEEVIRIATNALYRLLKRAKTLDTDEQASIQKVLAALQAYPTETFTGSIEVMVDRRFVEGGCSYASMRIDEAGLELSSGGSVYDPAVGSDSFTRTNFAHRRETNEIEEEFGWENSWWEAWLSNLPGNENFGEQPATASVEDESEPLLEAVDEAAETFATYTAQLPTLLTCLQECAPASRLELAGRIARETPGVYVFYDWHGAPQYVGRTRDLRRRLGEHGRESSSHYSASFAFLRAREAAKRDGHDLRGFSRQELAGEHLAFQLLFAKEKRAVAGMEVRWVVVSDAVTQALLEVYVALELGTPFNSFETS